MLIIWICCGAMYTIETMKFLVAERASRQSVFSSFIFNNFYIIRLHLS